MNPLKKLAGQTAIYGVPSIVGRLLNYFLFPWYTRIFTPGEYGVVTEMYAFLAFFLVVLTFGMETTFFRFSDDKLGLRKVYSNVLTFLFSLSILFLILAFAFSGEVASFLTNNGAIDRPYETYVQWFAIIIVTDAIASIPFALLRKQGKSKKFAVLKMINISFNIILNIFFLVICRDAYLNGGNTSFLGRIYDPNMGVGYIFLANLITSIITIIVLYKELFWFRPTVSKEILIRMLKYTYPLVILGFAGIINEALDRILLKYYLPYSPQENEALIGIYGACYKVSILMTIFIQAFRFAAEPFFFGQREEKDSKKVYADIAKYFTLVCSIIFLAVMMNIGWIIELVGEDFREGKHIVPILLLANLFLGLFYNLSIWYKLTDKTIYGAYLSILGACITIVLNIWWIPIIGYEGSAWATLCCYAVMLITSYVLGQKYYPVPYSMFRISGYLIGAIVLYLMTSYFVNNESLLVQIVIGNVILLFYVSVAYFVERPKKILS